MRPCSLAEGFYLSSPVGQPSLHSQSSLSRSPGAHMPSSLSREKEHLLAHKSLKDPLRERERDREREMGKEKAFKIELGAPLQRRDRERDRECERERDRERDRSREEPRPHSVVDLTQDVKTEDERERRPLSGSERLGKSAMEHAWPAFHQHPLASSVPDAKPKNPLQTSSLSNCRGSSGGGTSQGGSSARCPSGEPDRDRGPRDDENARPGVGCLGSHLHPADRQKRCDSMSAPGGPLHMSYAVPSSLQSPLSHLPPRLVSSGTYPPPHHMPPSLYPFYSASKEPGKEHRVIAPTYVPSVEVYDERKGPIQIASQARDNKNDKSREREREREKDRERERDREAYRSVPLVDRTHADHGRSSVRSESPLHSDFKRDIMREEGSVIRSNGLAIKRPPPSDMCTSKSRHSPDTRDYPSAPSRHMIKMGLEAESRNQERERDRDRTPRPTHPFTGMDPAALHTDPHPHKGFATAEPKWKPFDMGNYATNHMAALASHHGHTGHGGGEEGGKRMYLDPSGLHRPSGSGNSPEGLHPDPHPGEVSAMQSLIKYSGNFPGEPGSRLSPGGGRSPFGGLGSMKLEAGAGLGHGLGHAHAHGHAHGQGHGAVSKVQHLPPQQPGKQLKRDPERPDSAKSFGRDGGGSAQGEVEVRHPPVGIAVAVARQRDNSSKPSSGPGDRERPIPGGGIKSKNPALAFSI